MAKATYKKKTPEQQKAEVADLTENMDKAIEGHFLSPENLKDYLQFMAQFYQYSPNNVSLIQQQFRGASAVGSFKFWKDKGYSVQKGEKGIKILTPCPVKGRYQDAEGNWKLLKEAKPDEKKKIKSKEFKSYPDYMKYSIGHVYDISQTNAPASNLPKIFPNRWLDGKVDNYEVFQKGLEKVADHIGVKIEPCRTDLGAVKGVFYPLKNSIELNHRNSEVQNATTLIHELAHAKLHSGMKVFNIEKHEAEFQAEMVSYAVSAYFGLGGEDKEEKSLQYIYNWTKDQTLDSKEKLLKEVRAASVEFIEIIEKELVKAKEIEAERINDQTGNKVYLVRYEGIDNARIEEMGKEQFVNWSITNEFAPEMFKDKPDLLIKRFNGKNKEKFFAINEEDWPTTKNNAKRPLMLVKWSEHHQLSGNSAMPFGQANELILKLEKEVQLDKMAGREGLDYYKTRYNVLVPQENKVSIINPERYEIGDYFHSGPMEQIVKDQEQYGIQYLTDVERSILLDEIVYQKENSKVVLKEDSKEIHLKRKKQDLELAR